MKTSFFILKSKNLFSLNVNEPAADGMKSVDDNQTSPLVPRTTLFKSSRTTRVVKSLIRNIYQATSPPLNREEPAALATKSSANFNQKHSFRPDFTSTPTHDVPKTSTPVSKMHKRNNRPASKLCISSPVTSTFCSVSIICSTPVKNKRNDEPIVQFNSELMIKSSKKCRNSTFKDELQAVQCHHHCHHNHQSNRKITLKATTLLDEKNNFSFLRMKILQMKPKRLKRMYVSKVDFESNPTTNRRDLIQKAANNIVAYSKSTHLQSVTATANAVLPAGERLTLNYDDFFYSEKQLQLIKYKLNRKKHLNKRLLSQNNDQS